MNRAKSKQEKQLQGTYRKHRDKPKEKVTVMRSQQLINVPDTPGSLQDEEEVYFINICQLKIDNNQLSEVDVTEIEILAKMIYQRKKAMRLLEVDGAIQEFNSGAKQVNACFSVLEKLDKMVSSKLKLLGCDTPTLKKIERLHVNFEYKDNSEEKEQLDDLIEEAENFTI